MQEERAVCFGPFRFERTNEQVWRGSKACKLTGKAFAVLRYLVEHPGQLVTKEDLFQAVWPEVVVSDAALTVCIREIRQALEDDTKTPRYIETVPKRGYRWIAPLTASQPVQRSRFKVQGFKSEPTPSAPRSTLSAPRLVGREAELARLHDWLGKALSGERQLVFVTGEPGIGKTTLIEAFLLGVGDWGLGVSPSSPYAKFSTPSTQPPKPSPWLARGQCIDLHGAGEPYMPVLEALSRLRRAPGGDYVVKVLNQYAPTWLVQMPALLTADELATLQLKVQGATRERMLREMAEALEVLTAERPLVLVLEDLHWSDPSTVDLLATLARRREPARLLVLGTYRPVEVLGDGHPLTSVLQELQAHNLCVELALGLLTPADTEAYLHQRFPASALPTDLAQTLWHRTGGNPLFLVNIVDDLVTRGLMIQEDGGWMLEGGLEAVDEGIPKSIRQLIARQSARLLPAEQQMLEAASMAGMEFSAAAVAAALEESTVAIEEQCAGLVNRQHFLRLAGLSEWPDGTLAVRYTFLHALYQQLWHERVSPSRLQQYHLQIGERKEAAYGDRANEIAAELALHFEQGRDYPRAVQYLQQAAQNAKERSANAEAINHLTKALELLKTFPDTPERAQQELTLQIALGAPLIVTKGYSVSDVGQVYSRARELAQQLGELPHLFTTLYGLAAFSVVRGELPTAHKLTEQLLNLVQNTPDSALSVMAHRGLGTTLFFLGEFSLARKHFEQGLALYDPLQHRLLMFRYGVDPKVSCLLFLAQTLWYLGYPDQARQRIAELLSLVQELAHPYSQVGALLSAAWLHQHCGDVPVMQAQAEAAITLSTGQKFSLLLAMGHIFRGWTLAEQSHLTEGMIERRRGFAIYRETETKNQMPYYLTLLSDVYGKAGQAGDELAVLTEALEIVNKTEERQREAELYRLKGELVLQSGVRGPEAEEAKQKPVLNGVEGAKGKRRKAKIPNTQYPTPSTQAEAEAEACFLKAIDIARKQSAKSLELRAVTSLSRLWQQQGKEKEDHQLLAEIYDWFTEGFDTKDLQEAKALLGEMQR